MISVNNDDTVTFGDYKQFWFLFIEMYGQILQTKINYDENTAQLTHQTFQKILNKKEDLLDTDFFNEQEFIEARKKARSSPDTADLFAWLDTP
jgi:hypothetical protein